MNDAVKTLAPIVILSFLESSGGDGTIDCCRLALGKRDRQGTGESITEGLMCLDFYTAFFLRNTGPCNTHTPGGIDRAGKKCRSPRDCRGHWYQWGGAATKTVLSRRRYSYMPCSLRIPRIRCHLLTFFTSMVLIQSRGLDHQSLQAPPSAFRLIGYWTWMLSCWEKWLGSLGLRVPSLHTLYT